MRVYAWRSPPSLLPQERGNGEWKYRDRGVCGHAALNKIHGQYELRCVQSATILCIDKVPGCLHENLCRKGKQMDGIPYGIQAFQRQLGA